MKVYLNRGVFANRAAPTFATADMQEVIRLGNEIIASNRYSLSSPTVVGYVGNFAPNNDAISTENVIRFIRAMLIAVVETSVPAGFLDCTITRTQWLERFYHLI
jgi:hypothetical protein